VVPLYQRHDAQDPCSGVSGRSRPVAWRAPERPLTGALTRTVAGTWYARGQAHRGGLGAGCCRAITAAPVLMRRAADHSGTTVSAHLAVSSSSQSGSGLPAAMVLIQQPVQVAVTAVTTAPARSACPRFGTRDSPVSASPRTSTAHLVAPRASDYAASPPGVRLRAHQPASARRNLGGLRDVSAPMRTHGGRDTRPEGRYLLQETLLRACGTCKTTPPHHPPAALALYVARRVRHRRRPGPPAETTDTDVQRPAATRDDIERLLGTSTVCQALTTLTHDHRQVLIEIYYRNRSVARPPKTLANPEDTVNSGCSTHYAPSPSPPTRRSRAAGQD